MKSQYVSAYLQYTMQQGEGNGYTPGTFLQYTLRGEAKRWIGRYTAALIRSLESMNNVTEGKSKKGRTAYYLSS